jgi:hypothetical protein
MDTPRSLPSSHQPRTLPRAGRAVALGFALGLAALLASPQVAAQDNGCSMAGRNAQCTAFGTVSMESQRDIRGDPIDVSIPIELSTAYADQGTRWLLFSVRNVTSDGSNPVTIQLTKFSTDSGDVVTTRVEQRTPNELNLWVDILDTPVQKPITLDVQVGSTERGAFRLETLVMAFDRGYSPIKDSDGNDASLFSFTLLGVNKETGGMQVNGGSLSDGHKLPGLEALPILAALGAAAVLARRRVA